MNTTTLQAKQLASNCLHQLLSCLSLILPSFTLPLGSTSNTTTVITDQYHDPSNPTKIRGQQEPPGTRKKKGKKYQRVENQPPLGSDEENEEEDLEEGTLDQSDNKDQFFNDFSSWRSQNQHQQSSPSKQTELAEMKKPQKQNNNNNLLTMSENEIDSQRNKIDGDEDLFKSFDTAKKLQPPPQSKSKRVAAVVNNFLDTLPDTQQPINLQPSLIQPPEQQQQQLTLVEEKGWGEAADDDVELDIQID